MLISDLEQAIWPYTVDAITKGALATISIMLISDLDQAIWPNTVDAITKGALATISILREIEQYL